MPLCYGVELGLILMGVGQSVRSLKSVRVEASDAKVKAFDAKVKASAERVKASAVEVRHGRCATNIGEAVL